MMLLFGSVVAVIMLIPGMRDKLEDVRLLFIIVYSIHLDVIYKSFQCRFIKFVFSCDVS